MSETSKPVEIDTEPRNPAVVSAEGGKARKAPRLPLEFAVMVRYEGAVGEMVRTRCKTVSVCVNGALLAMPGAVSIGQSLHLTNVKTAQEAECIVRSVREPEKGNIALVGIEFAGWLPEFWEILFPRDADDPPPVAEPEKPRPEKPFFGRARTMPEKTAAAVPAAPEPSTAVATGNEEHTAARSGSTTARGGRAMAALAAAVVVTVVIVAWVLLRPAARRVPAGEQESALALPAEVAKLVPNAMGSRLAKSADFAPEAVGFLQSLGQDAAGQITGKLAGAGQWQAYLMRASNNSWRVCIVGNGVLLYDQPYEAVAIAGRIPLSVASSVRWSVPPPEAPSSDGLLIVHPDGQNRSAQLLFVQGAEVISGTPEDYAGIPALLAR